MSQAANPDDHRTRPSREMGVSTMDSELMPEFRPIPNDMVRLLPWLIAKLNKENVGFLLHARREFLEWLFHNFLFFT